MKKKTTFIERERISGIRYIECLAATVRATWAACCRADGIPEGALFVEFSETNAIVPFHTRALAQYQEARVAFLAQGYVGLTTESRELFAPKRQAHANPDVSEAA